MPSRDFRFKQNILLAAIRKLKKTQRPGPRTAATITWLTDVHHDHEQRGSCRTSTTANCEGVQRAQEIVAGRG